jgi:hypothetical protein
MAIPSPNLSTLEKLRQGVQQRFEANLLVRVQGAMATSDSPHWRSIHRQARLLLKSSS